MFNSSFFKFLIIFTILIGGSFLIMAITSAFDSKADINNASQPVILN